MIRSLVGLLILVPFTASDVFAGRVRNLSMDDKRMEVVRLSMGKSTILRFKDKPKKGIVGNSNYFSVEYVDHDVAIQPLGVFTTNLFIYTEFGRMYGLILKSTHSSQYDDLVNIVWRSNQRIKVAKPKRPKTTKKDFGRKFKVGSSLEVNVLSVTKNETLGLYFVDMKLKNTAPGELNLKEAEITLTRSGKKLPHQRFVIMDEILAKDGATEGRVIIKGRQSRGMSLEIKNGNDSAKTIISRTLL